METKIFSKIEDTPAGEWGRVYPPVPENYDFFRALDDSRPEQFSLRYLLVYDRGEVVGAAACFLMDYALDSTIQGPLKHLSAKLKKRFPGILNVKVLMCGQPTGPGSLGFRGDSAPVVRAIQDAMERIAAEERAAFLVFKEFGPPYKEVLAPLKKEGYHEFLSIPNTVKELRFKSFDEFLMSLSYKTRYDLKRKFKKTENLRLDFEVVDRLDGVLDEAYALYLQMTEKHDIGFEVMPKAFFARIAETMPGRAKFFLWRIEGRLVAFAFCLVSGDHFLDSYLGLDYAVAHENHLYFLRFRDMLNWCLERGMKTYEMGCTNYDPKKRLDFTFVPMTIHAKMRNRWLNPFLGIACELIKPERYDPVLRQMKKDEARRCKKTSGALALKVLLLILVNELVDSSAQVLMKKGLPGGDFDFPRVGEIARFLSESAVSGWVWLGVLTYALNFFLWIAVLSQVDLSMAVPLSGVTYAMIPLMALVFLHEKIGWLRWTGVGLIVLGVYLISKNLKHEKEGSAQ